jgi:hypothetical protein
VAKVDADLKQQAEDDDKILDERKSKNAALHAQKQVSEAKAKELEE